MYLEKTEGDRKMKTNRLICSSSLFLLVLLSGCSSSLPIQEIPVTANVVQELQSFDSAMNEAVGDQVNVLSPHNFKEAEVSLVDAKKGLDKQREAKYTLNKIATGRAYLKRAKEVASVSHANMEEVITARQKAIANGAPGFFKSDFRKADSELKEVTADVEVNDLKSISKQRSTLLATYLDLELRAIKQANLGNAKTKIRQALKLGAEKMAPQTLAIAEKNFIDTDAYITANRHEIDQIRARSAAVNQSADHLLTITQASIDTKKVSPEELALQMDKKQRLVSEKQKDLVAEQEVTQALSEENKKLQDLALEKQNELETEQQMAASLAAKSAVLEEQIAAKEKDLIIEQSVTESLSATNRALAEEKVFNEKFEKAGQEFTKDEAQVHREGNTLTIRLHGLSFPSAKATLEKSNFPLLSKVQKVIKEFGDSSVVIEGHTDSTGEKMANAKVSEDRAQAVREYFISNGILPEDKIKAVGLGNQKPLATNKTVAGRAQNRRVDVVIKVEGNKKL